MYTGNLIGTKLMQQRGNVGGAKAVFVKLKGKEELIFPTFGGQLVNPFANGGKIFAGDLMEYRTNEDGLKPKIYLLKTFVAAADSATTSVTIVADGYHHVPSVGDKLMIAPNALSGTGTGATVTAVAAGVTANTLVLTLSASIGSVEEGDILVEATATGNSAKMLVSNPNAFAPCDYELLGTPATGSSDYDGARFFLTPVLHGITYLKKMSPVPACVLALNKSNVNGWFEL